MEILTGGPVIVLVEPQLGENIGMVARAMANFGLSELRLVNPRDGWPNDRARAAAAKADHVIDSANVFDTLEEAIGDLQFVMATTARPRDMIKPILSPETAVQSLRARMVNGGQVGILFGRERWGLENDEIALANEIVTFPVNPAFASLNIAQAVLLVSYEWMKCGLEGEEVSVTGEPNSLPAKREDLIQLIDHLESALEDAHYFYPPAMKEIKKTNLRTLFTNADLTAHEVHFLRGVVAALERRWQKGRDSSL